MWEDLSRAVSANKQAREARAVGLSDDPSSTEARSLRAEPLA